MGRFRGRSAYVYTQRLKNGFIESIGNGVLCEFIPSLIVKLGDFFARYLHLLLSGWDVVREKEARADDSKEERGIVPCGVDAANGIPPL